MRDLILWIMIALLFGIATGEFGYICGKWESFDRDGKMAQHEIKIQILQSEMRLVKERLRIP